MVFHLELQTLSCNYILEVFLTPRYKIYISGGVRGDINDDHQNLPVYLNIPLVNHDTLYKGTV